MDAALIYYTFGRQQRLNVTNNRIHAFPACVLMAYWQLTNIKYSVVKICWQEQKKTWNTKALVFVSGI